MRRVLSSFVFTAALLCPWLAQAQLQVSPPSTCSITSQNIFVRNQLNVAYYWNQHLPGTSPANYDSPEAYLEAVRYRPIDNFYSYITSAAANDAFFNDSQFVGFGFRQETTTDTMLVQQVYEGSPALEAGLSRGDRITAINGQSVSSLVRNGTVGSAFGPPEIGVVAEIEFETAAGELKQGRMAKRLVTIPTVSVTRMVEADGRRVGYLMFNNFVRPSTAALNDAFAALKAGGANELILDLRYNGGGLVDVAVQLASLIGGTRTSGQVMINWAYNDRLSPLLNRSTRFQETPANTLNLERLFVITTQSSASASELIINSLRPFIPVVVIGDTTYGKPVGQNTFNFCDKVLAPVVFSLRNANNEGDFFDGIPADCPAADDALHQLGDTEEASFAEALTFMRTGACSPRAEETSRTLRARRAASPRPIGWAALVNAQ
jgi:carboxyl-terminal processing protease